MDRKLLRHEYEIIAMAEEIKLNPVQVKAVLAFYSRLVDETMQAAVELVSDAELISERPLTRAATLATI